MIEIRKRHYIIQLKELGDDRGGLIAVEEYKDLPFKIKRVFYEYNSLANITRGNHANKISRFGLVSIVGSCSIEIDDGRESVKYILDSPNKLLYLDRMIWKVMKDFSSNNVLLVLSDQKYYSSEYIKDYAKFRKLISIKSN